jgi:hypothetical protein
MNKGGGGALICAAVPVGKTLNDALCFSSYWNTLNETASSGRNKRKRVFAQGLCCYVVVEYLIVQCLAVERAELVSLKGERDLDRK